MITVSRSGERISADELTEQQKKDLALAVFRAFCGMHPEMIRQAVADYQKEAGI